MEKISRLYLSMQLGWYTLKQRFMIRVNIEGHTF